MSKLGSNQRHKDFQSFALDKYTQLNILELENSDLLHLSHLKNPTRGRFTKEELEHAKASNLMFNHINVAQGIYIEMRYRTMKKTHALKILNTMIPPIVNDPLGYQLLQTSSYDQDFIKFCVQYKS